MKNVVVDGRKEEEKEDDKKRLDSEKKLQQTICTCAAHGRMFSSLFAYRLTSAQDAVRISERKDITATDAKKESGGDGNAKVERKILL